MKDKTKDKKTPFKPKSNVNKKTKTNGTLIKSKIKLPITEKVGKEIVTLPTHPNISKTDVEKIIKIVNKYS